MADSKRNQVGLSLIELLVGISLTAVVLLAIGAFLTNFVHINSKVTIKNDYDRKSQLALTIITEELRYLQFDLISLAGEKKEIDKPAYYTKLVYDADGMQRRIFIEKDTLVIEKENNRAWHGEGIQDVWFRKDDQKKRIEVQVRPVLKNGEKRPIYKTIIKPLN